METIEAVVSVDFALARDASYSKAWKRLKGIELEQAMALPRVVLAAGNLIELMLDGETREVRIEHLRWDQGEGRLSVHAVPTAVLAAEVKEQGLNAWRPWIGKRAAKEFLERCLQMGWRTAGGAPAPQAPAVQRREPTL